jgi:hypothetical protein
MNRDSLADYFLSDEVFFFAESVHSQSSHLERR